MNHESTHRAHKDTPVHDRVDFLSLFAGMKVAEENYSLLSYPKPLIIANLLLSTVRKSFII